MLRQIEGLFARQARAWPALASGLQGLASVRTVSVRIDWYEVLVQHIPHRAGSTTAAVDPVSIAKRPCFLCRQNLPPEEEGVPFNAEFTIYCNPFPIVESHLTIVSREHTRQRIAGQIGTMLELAKALPGYFVIYNGPECGASAPDHLHFQAGSCKNLPIVRDTAALAGIAVPNYGRNVFLFRGEDGIALRDRVRRAIELLAEATGKRDEPLLNLAAFHDATGWTVYLFPRAKHRPQVFYSGELTVSPAAVDLCGLFVVPVARDFDKITADAIAAIFREVTLPDDQFRCIADRLEQVR